MIVIATHAVILDNKDIHGPPHAVSQYLNKKKKAHIFIKHPLEVSGQTIVEIYGEGKLKNKETVGISTKLPSALQYCYEMLLTIYLVYKFCHSNIELFIGVDPLNVLSGLILRLFTKVDKIVYFSADFSLRRFKNTLLNSIYLLLDRQAMFGSDYTWSVSKRIVSYRKKQGLEDIKNKHLPNAPFYKDVPQKSYKKTKSHDLVIVSAINQSVDFKLLIDVIKMLVKNTKNVKLHIIGSGPMKQELEEYIFKLKLRERVVFHGTLSHTDMFNILVKCGIGIALYKNADKKHFRYYSDPMKVRDYLASGLPVIISGNSDLGFELARKGAGLWVKLEKKSVYNALNKMFKPSIHEEMRMQAISMAKENDIEELLNQYIPLKESK